MLDPAQLPLTSFSIRENSVSKSVEEALNAIQEFFPEAWIANRHYAEDSDIWNLNSLSLRHRIHPIAPSLKILSDTKGNGAENEDTVWALADAWHWLSLIRLAQERPQFFPHADFADLKRVRDYFTEVEAFAVCCHLWPDAQIFPVSPHSGSKEPEFYFEVPNIGRIGIEAKCIAPLNETEATFAIKATRLASSVIHELQKRKLAVLIEIDKQMVDSQDITVLKERMLKAAEQLIVDSVEKSPREILSTSQRDGFLMQQCLGLRMGDRLAPPDALILEGWWDEEESRSSDHARSDNGQPAPQILFSISPRECSVTIRNANGYIFDRVRRNIYAADKKFHNIFGLSWIRINHPPYLLPSQSMLSTTWEKAVIPAIKNKHTEHTSAIILASVCEARPHPSTMRQFMGNGTSLKLSRPTHPYVQINALFGETDPLLDQKLIRSVKMWG